MNKKWTRQDVVNWMRTINECGCEDADVSINDSGMPSDIVSIEPSILRNQVQSQHGIMHASCPDSYEKVADYVCQDPHSVIEALKPIMAEIGVGCPQSFAKALTDVFEVGQEMGMISPFNTEQI